jgi:hypothetical protein
LQYHPHQEELQYRLLQWQVERPPHYLYHRLLDLRQSRKEERWMEQMFRPYPALHLQICHPRKMTKAMIHFGRGVVQSHFSKFTVISIDLVKEK